MRRLVICLLIVLAVGGVMVAAGAAAGGILYGASNINGGFQLVPVGELAPLIGRTIVHEVTDEIGDHFGLGTRLGSALIGNRIAEEITDEVLDDLDDFYNDWDDDHDDDRRRGTSNDTKAATPEGQTIPGQDSALENVVIPSGNQTIRELDFTFSNTGTVNLLSGDAFDLSGDFTVLKNKVEDDEWKLSLSTTGETTITLPESVQSYESIAIESSGSGTIFLSSALYAQEIDIELRDGALYGDLLSAREIDIDADTGAVTALLESGTSYTVKWQVRPTRANDTGGTILLDGEIIADGASGKSTEKIQGSSGCELDLSVSTGRIELNRVSEKSP